MRKPLDSISVENEKIPKKPKLGCTKFLKTFEKAFLDICSNKDDWRWIFKYLERDPVCEHN